MKKVIFSGYYGHKNMGDDAFGMVSIWGARKYWKVKPVLLSSQGPTNDNIDITYALPKKQRFRGEFLFYTTRNLLTASMVILSGGSILHAKHKVMTIHGLIFLFSKLKLCKIGAIGVSIGPFKTKEDYEYIKKQLYNFEFLVLRDRKSYDIAISMNLPYEPIFASDLAFMLPQIQLESRKEKNEKKVLGISLCHYERYIQGDMSNESRREEAIIKVLREVLNAINVRFRFFVINGNESFGDEEITVATIRALELNQGEYEIVRYSSDTLLMLDAISKCDVMITTRLHGAIFSATVNIPALLVEYHEKCTDYLNDIGLDESWRIGDMVKTTSSIKDKILMLIKDRQLNFYPNRDMLLSRAKNNFTKVHI